MMGRYILWLLLLLRAYQQTDALITAWTEPPISSANGNGVTSVMVKENLTQGTQTGVKISALGSNPVTYTFRIQMPPNTFTIDSATGEVTLASASLDYEKVAVHKLIVIATDNTNATGTATVTLSVENVPPTFSKQVFTETICDKSNGSNAGAVLVTLSATDSGNTSVTYSITGKGSADFSIDGSGVITLAKTLNSTAATMYTLTVNAVDTASIPGTGSATVAVTVQDCNAGNETNAPIVFVLLGTVFASLWKQHL